MGWARPPSGLRRQRRAPARAAQSRRRLGAGAEALPASAVERACDLFGTATQVRADAERLELEGRTAVRDGSQGRRRDAGRTLAEAERRASRIRERLSAFAGALARIEADTDATRIEMRSASEALGSLPRRASCKPAATDCRRAWPSIAAGPASCGLRPRRRRTRMSALAARPSLPPSASGGQRG